MKYTSLYQILPDYQDKEKCTCLSTQNGPAGLPGGLWCDKIQIESSGDPESK
jgi:hypothetical protein